MPKIDILMASYNGEKYISEQIESILGQTFQDFRLIIRDDGSRDSTPKIIERYAEKYPEKIKIIHDGVKCGGATPNFFELLKHAEADYVMFSDQDDVWLKYKVQITFDYMKKTESENPGKPVLVFTGLQVVDSELKSLDFLMALGFSEKFYTLRELVCRNCATGCTQMINRTMYEKLGNFEEDITLHDWWTSLYAVSFGAVVRVPMALILYRQHGGNVLGAKPKGYTLASKIIRYMTRPFYEASTTNRLNNRMQRLFFSRFSDSMSPETLEKFNDYFNLFSKNIITRFKAIMKYRDSAHFHSGANRFLWLRLLFLGGK